MIGTKRMRSHSVADLFCGAGGLSLGAVNAGFSIKIAIDNWTTAVRNYNANKKDKDNIAEVHDLSDIKKISTLLSEQSVEVIIGGPPCQDFSLAGKGIEGDRAELTVSFAKIVATVRPLAFLMENVPTSGRSNAYAKAMSILKESGYDIESCIVNASHYGVPQRRRRLITVGTLFKKKRTYESILETRKNETETTVREYFESLNIDVNFSHYYRHPRSYSRRGIFSIDEPSPTIRGVSRPLPPNYKMHALDTCAPNPTLRALSNGERSLVQTFPIDFIWEGNNSEISQMIGNAVPPLLAKHLFEALEVVLFEHSQSVATPFDQRP